MAIASNFLHTFRVLNQGMTNLIQLQRDVRANAQSWRASAVAQSVPQATLAQWMNDAAAAYSTRLDWLTTLQANTALWNAVKAMWTLLGGTQSDFSSIVTPLRAVANQLAPADKSTYAAIITACDSIISAINAPDSLWPE